MLLSNNSSCLWEGPIERFDRDKRLCALNNFFHKRTDETHFKAWAGTLIQGRVNTVNTVNLQI